MKSRLIAIGILIAVLGGFLYALSFWRAAPPQTCTVTNPVPHDGSRTHLLVTTDTGAPILARRGREDRHEFREGERVLVEFPLMGDPCVVTGPVTVIQYIRTYPLLLAVGVAIMMLGLRRKVEQRN